MIKHVTILLQAGRERRTRDEINILPLLTGQTPKRQIPQAIAPGKMLFIYLFIYSLSLNKGSIMRVF